MRWTADKPRIRRDGGLFRLGDVVPEGYFTEEEIADLVARGKLAVSESKVVELGRVEEPEQVDEPEELEQTEELEQLDEPEEPEQHDTVDLGGATSDKPKGKPRRRGR